MYATRWMGRALGVAIVLVIAATAWSQQQDDYHERKGGNNMSTDAKASDREQIIEHIHAIFRAYFAKDRETIRRNHTADWKGFLIRSTKMVRGIDAYMAHVDGVLQGVVPSRYEIVDIDVDVYGDVAVVFYLAREWIPKDGGGEKTILLRSCDIYRRDPDGWNQCASNIMAVPDVEGPMDLSCIFNQSATPSPSAR